MFRKLKQSWRELQRGEPGRRFEDRWRRKGRSSAARKALALGTGTVVVALGLLLLPAPGPGTIVLALGAALLAEESRWVARALDRAELLLRSALRRLRTRR